MVAREGSAPSISGCRPDVMLFHHQAVEGRLANIGRLAWICTKTDGVKTRYAACYTTRQKLVEPEVVATSPYRIKSPVPVCCGFDSLKMVLATGVAPALATLSTSCLFCWTTRAEIWSLQPVLLRQNCFTKAIRRLRRGGRYGRSLRCRPGHGGLMKPT